MTRRSDLRPESKWTMVGTETGRQFFVRLRPNCVDLEELGRPWGLCFMNLYDDKDEAHRFADSIDLFMDAVEKGILKGNLSRTGSLLVSGS